MSKGILKWKGDLGKPDGQYTTTTIEGVIDSAALATFATAMLTHTNCNLASRTFVKETWIDDSPPGTDENVDRYAKVEQRDSANGKKRTFKLACPLASEVEQTPDGERLDVATQGTLAAATSVATGKTLTPVDAPVLQKE